MAKKSIKQTTPILRYLDPSQDLEERVQDLLGRLTLDEKFDLCSGRDSWYTKEIPRLGIKSFAMTDGPHGVAPHSSGGKECTYFPTGICRAATWNPDLSKDFGVAMAQEVRDVGYHMILGPGVNIHRTPLGGRNFEYQTEDPHLNAKLIVPAVRGIQSQRIAACVKHYACNNQEMWRTWVDSIVGERAMHEIYLPAFEAAVNEGDAWSLMGAYNRVNGSFACESVKLLSTLLKGEWNFHGFVVSDWGALNFIDNPENSVNVGLSLEMPTANKYNKKLLQDMLTEGKFSESALNNNVERLLRVMFLVGLFDDPTTLPKGSRNTREHQAVARQIAEEGVVLLKNDHNLLPLETSLLKNVAVLGPNADRKLGPAGGSSEVRPPYEVTPLAGIKAKCGSKIKVSDVASGADAAILVVGLNHDAGLDAEGADRKTMDLPQGQDDLILKTVAANPKTIVVLVSGNPVNMEEWIDKVPAVVEMWYAGMEGGNALANVLFGDVNPSGKLPVTFPKKLFDSPAHASVTTYPGIDDEDLGPVVRYDEDIFVGYRHFDAKGIEPRFPFGHGLSYTTFEYKNLEITPEKPGRDDNISISVEVTNTDERAGAEVVQLYIGDPEASVPRPPKELKGFAKITLPPNTQQKIVFVITTQDLSFFNVEVGKWKAEPGKFNVFVGSSSRDIRLQGTFEYSP